MIETSGISSIILAHILQFSSAMVVVVAMTWLAARRWPHFTFLVCMLALAKCLVPPLITSPAGIFTRTPSLAFSPQLAPWAGDRVVELKRFASVVSPESELPLSTLLLTGMLEMPTPVEAFHWLLTFLSIWLFGVLLVLIWARRQFSRLRQVLCRCLPSTERIRHLSEELQRQLGIRKPVEILVSPDNFGPATIGFLNPKVILPERLVATWSNRLVRPVLAHEIMHARRGDFIWGCLQFIAQVIWWFHPLVWWLGRRANILCERCCDDDVLALTNCKTSDYAESLVSVLALRGTIHPLPLCRPISPVAITRQRLERLLKRCGKSTGSTRANWLLIALLAILVIPGMQWVARTSIEAQETPLPTSESQYRSEINKSIAEGNWRTAIELLRPAVEKDQRNAGAIFYLGYALHAAGKLDEAIYYHERAAAFEPVKAPALYNWACALALLDKPDAALQKLEESLDAGFVQHTDLADDVDLKSLFATEKFKELRKRANNQALRILAARQFDSWKGDWEVVSSNGEIVGYCRISTAEKGHILIEEWQNLSRNTGVNHLNPGTRALKTDWIEDQGSVTKNKRQFADGKIQFTGMLSSSNGDHVRSRMSLAPKVDGTLRQCIEISHDDGMTWQPYFEGSYRRLKTNSGYERSDD